MLLFIRLKQQCMTLLGGEGRTGISTSRISADDVSRVWQSLVWWYGSLWYSTTLRAVLVVAVPSSVSQPLHLPNRFCCPGIVAEFCPQSQSCHRHPVRITSQNTPDENEGAQQTSPKRLDNRWLAGGSLLPRNADPLLKTMQKRGARNALRTHT